jgi:ABC-type nitrate/sulfonate/bicarbonate transport system permease component
MKLEGQVAFVTGPGRNIGEDTAKLMASEGAWYRRFNSVLDPLVGMYGATHGIGFLIAVSGARFQTDKVMVGIIIALAVILMTELLRAVERRFERWRPNNRG